MRLTLAYVMTEVLYAQGSTMMLADSKSLGTFFASAFNPTFFLLQPCSLALLLLMLINLI
jgi:hypothetical protein